MTVPVPHHVRDAFQRLSAAQGCSVGKAMGDWLADTVEGVTAMAELLERAREQPRKAIYSVSSYAASIEGVLDRVMVTVAGDVVTGEDGGAVRRSGRAAAATPSEPGTTLTPPVSNTGGKVPRKRPGTRGGKP